MLVNRSKVTKTDIELYVDHAGHVIARYSMVYDYKGKKVRRIYEGHVHITSATQVGEEEVETDGA